MKNIIAVRLDTQDFFRCIPLIVFLFKIPVFMLKKRTQKEKCSPADVVPTEHSSFFILHSSFIKPAVYSRVIMTAHAKGACCEHTAVFDICLSTFLV